MSFQPISVWDLAFRAACNAAVVEGKRPVRRRVMARLAQMPETHDILRDLQLHASPLPGQSAFDLLGKDERWKTLVAETLADRLDWSDFARRGIAFGERVGTIWRKITGGADQQVARIVVATLTSVSLAWYANDRAGGDLFQNMFVSIRTTLVGPSEPLEVKFKLSADNGTIPVTFVPTASGQSIPVKLELRTSGEPIVVDVGTKAHEVYGKELLQLTGQLRRGNESLAKLVDTAGFESGELAEQLAALQEQMRRVADLHTKVADQEFSGLGRKLQGIAAVQHYDVRVDQNHPRVLLLQSFDHKAGEYRAVNVLLCLKALAKRRDQTTVTYWIAEADGQTTCASGDYKIEEGKSEPREVGPENWVVTVHSVKRRWNGEGQATFSLRPVAQSVESVVSARQSG